MSRLYDRILRASRGGKYTPLIDSDFIPYAREDARDLPGTTVIATDNVTQYFYEVSGDDDWRSGGGFPNVAPPLEQFFMETRRPKAVRDSRGRDVDDPTAMPPAWGALFRCEDFKTTFDADPEWRSYAREAFALSSGRLGIDASIKDSSQDPFEMELAEDIRWLMRLSCYVEDPAIGSVFAGTPVRDNIALTAQQFVAVTEEGQIAHFSDGRRARLQMPMLAGEPHAYHLAMNARYFAHPFMAAISFMHCKNVRLEEQKPPDKLSAKHQKNHGRPLTTYNLLEIGPMKEVLESEGRRGEVGLPRSFHICRGHFRTYVPERGGPGGRTITEPETQYVSAHTRGNKRSGEVRKDYNVNPTPGAKPKRRSALAEDPALEAARRATAGNPSESVSKARRQHNPGQQTGPETGHSDEQTAGARPPGTQPPPHPEQGGEPPEGKLRRLKRSLFDRYRHGRGPE